ncbi:MAG TPA: type VI secretion system tube protein Hcp [Vicinamibacterales bacterium]|nr:type VI secretion system tube protein Hcp [Vicinamibacterales bacterium]
MSNGVSKPNATHQAGAGDMFFKVKGAKHGQINGEAQDDKHKGEIEVLSWSWGMQGKASLGGGVASGKATMRELRIVKNVDKASTALMSALRTNEVIKEGILTLRKTGTSKIEYFKITIQDGRVVSLDVEAGDESGGSTLLERVSFSFNKIAIEYTPQGGDGMPQGSTTFEDQWGESS